MRIPRSSKPLTVLVVIAMAWTGLLIALFGTADEGLLHYIDYQGVMLVGLVALALGMRWRTRWPTLAFMLLVIGAIAPAVAYWLLPFTAPLALALIIVAFNNTIRAPGARDAVAI